MSPDIDQHAAVGRLDSHQELEAACDRIYHSFRAYQWPEGMEHMAEIGIGLAQGAVRASARRTIFRVPRDKLVGIRLDVGCGFNKQDGFIGMDWNPETNAEIVHDINDRPWPLEDRSCRFVLLSHVMEHLDPRGNIELMNEVWRVLEPRGKVAVSVPYAGGKFGRQDPTHMREGFLPDTFSYFCPAWSGDEPNPNYDTYRAKPFKVVGNPEIRDGWYINLVMEAMNRTEGDQPVVELAPES